MRPSALRATRRISAASGKCRNSRSFTASRCFLSRVSRNGSGARAGEFAADLAVEKAVCGNQPLDQLIHHATPIDGCIDRACSGWGGSWGRNGHRTCTERARCGPTSRGFRGSHRQRGPVRNEQGMGAVRQFQPPILPVPGRGPCEAWWRGFLKRCRLVETLRPARSGISGNVETAMIAHGAFGQATREAQPLEILLRHVGII